MMSTEEGEAENELADNEVIELERNNPRALKRKHTAPDMSGRYRQVLEQDEPQIIEEYIESFEGSQ